MVRKLLKDAAKDIIDLYMSSINIGELFYMLCRKNNPGFAKEALESTLQLPITIHVPSLQQTLQAAQLKAFSKLSFADAHAAALSIHMKATLVTGDAEFQILKSIKGFKLRFIT